MNVYNTFDQNRIYGAITYQISPNNQIQLGYLNTFQQKNAGDQYLRLHVVRLLYNQKFDWRKHTPAH